MKNKENTKAVKQASPETAGGELLKGNTIITKLGGIKVKLTKKIIADVFGVILNAQEEDIDEKIKNGGENIEISFDDLKHTGTEYHKDEGPMGIDKGRQGLINALSEHFKKCLNNFSDYDLIKLTNDLADRQEQKQLIN